MRDAKGKHRPRLDPSLVCFNHLLNSSFHRPKRSDGQPRRPQDPAISRDSLLHFLSFSPLFLITVGIYIS
ncbi:hypothetical protein PGT21_006220 [Puccinia graminis f. sp. tritici]|uniref:Uncharacterized protein n=1 Tax=Puccinia graminis f. sp. tritici TaxID=56615 RepID=A0A5B0PVQ9_PUCGR|nr:hypothetical protein PGT21_006220 [Puccinia graminis f. sp. tritici]KAA1104900.1 hypothetical protein PGTUg99_008558 [Puccinia graminis f. sp. tritici]